MDFEDTVRGDGELRSDLRRRPGSLDVSQLNEPSVNEDWLVCSAVFGWEAELGDGPADHCLFMWEVGEEERQGVCAELVVVHEEGRC